MGSIYYITACFCVLAGGAHAGFGFGETSLLIARTDENTVSFMSNSGDSMFLENNLSSGADGLIDLFPTSSSPLDTDLDLKAGYIFTSESDNSVIKTEIENSATVQIGCFADDPRAISVVRNMEIVLVGVQNLGIYSVGYDDVCGDGPETLIASIPGLNIFSIKVNEDTTTCYFVDSSGTTSDVYALDYSVLNPFPTPIISGLIRAVSCTVEGDAMYILYRDGTLERHPLGGPYDAPEIISPPLIPGGNAYVGGLVSTETSVTYYSNSFGSQFVYNLDTDLLEQYQLDVGEVGGMACACGMNCMITPCQNGGTCYWAGLQEGYLCQCEEGYTGTYCDQGVSCGAPTSGVNGAWGSCEGTDVIYPTSCTFTCNAGYVLTFGDTSTTCQSDGSFTAYTVPICSDIDDCTPNPCLNGGVCTDLVDAYSCSCTSDYQGAQCETYSACLLPVDMGACPTALLRWYYNSVVEQCQQFAWSGCGGNGNRFLAQADCQAVCET